MNDIKRTLQLKEESTIQVVIVWPLARDHPIPSKFSPLTFQQPTCSQHSRPSLGVTKWILGKFYRWKTINLALVLYSVTGRICFSKYSTIESNQFVSCILSCSDMTLLQIYMKNLHILRTVEVPSYTLMDVWGKHCEKQCDI